MGWTFIATGSSSPNEKVFAGFPPQCTVHIVIPPRSDALGVVREVKFGEEVGKISKLSIVIRLTYV